MIQILITVRQDTTDIVINSDEITAFDPDISYNTIDLEVDAATLSSELSATVSNDSLFITPNSNINGTYQINVIARENYDLHEFGCSTCPDPPLEDIKSFNITINSINDAPSVVSIVEQSTLEEQALNIDLNASDVDGDTEFTYTVSILNSSLATLTLESNVLTVNPVADQYGTTEISVIANDGLLDSPVSTFNKPSLAITLISVVPY